MWIVQQPIKDIHSEAGCEYTLLVQGYTILHRVNIRLIDCTPPWSSSTAIRRLYTEGKGTKSAHHVPQLPPLVKTSHYTCKYKAVSYPSTPPPHILPTINTLYMIYRTDTLLEREQTPGHIARQLTSHHRTLGSRHPLPPHGTHIPSPDNTR